MPPPHPSSSTPLTARRAIARDPHDGRWYDYGRALHTRQADHLDDVAPLLRWAEDEAGRGYWVVGWISYDAGPAFDSALIADRDPTVPLALFASFAERRIDRLDGGWFRCGPFVRTETARSFKAKVDQIKDHIAAGDTYQINLTYRQHAPFEGDPLGLFRALMAAQAADHGFFLDCGSVAVCSASPELFLLREPASADSGLGGSDSRLREAHRSDNPTAPATSAAAPCSGSGDGAVPRWRLITKPMKGTRPRGATQPADDALAIELAESVKDQAENTMIVDMMRNDLGRIAVPGSVTVPALHSIESYPTVLQMTSTVEALTTADLLDTMTTTFPPASITGAPKYRTTAFIAELESTPRGLYCGAIGILHPSGVASFNVAIRTVWIDQGRATYGVGGGIVWDSDRDAEWEETLIKTRVLDRACAPIGLIETMLVSTTPGDSSPRVRHLDRHLARLTRSAHELGYDLDPSTVLAAVAHRIASLPTADAPHRLRLVLYPDGRIETTMEPAPLPPARPWRVRLARSPIDSADPWLAHKSTMRHVFSHHLDDAVALGHRVDDVLLWNERGEITETTIGNVIVDFDGHWRTPSRHCGLLPGTARQRLIDLGRVEECVISLDDLPRAQNFYLLNAVRGLIPFRLDLADPIQFDKGTPR